MAPASMASGSIPACAGEPPRRLCGAWQVSVYPRVCGGTVVLTAVWRQFPGLSPRVRGTADGPRAVRKGRGLSPRVRGNPPDGRRRRQHRGSIPACAGEPTMARISLPPGTVYPRVCGGTEMLSDVFWGFPGLSPRVRGNQLGCHLEIFLLWSIPACAGEPYLRPRRQQLPAVYPRVCGGTVSAVISLVGVIGLSPRVRGNLGTHSWRCAALRSIPACAGEPQPSWTSWRRGGVYPRVCGGTATAISMAIAVAGLSPRVRGNHTKLLVRHCPPGSIPACAGEPSIRRASQPPHGVYPRVCGGTPMRTV